MSNRVVSIFVVGFTGSCLALTKVVAFENPGVGGGRALVVVLLTCRIIANRQFPQSLIVPPGFPSLGKTGFATDEDML